MNEGFCLHDYVFKRAYLEDNDYIIEIDYSDEYHDINKLILQNAKILQYDKDIDNEKENIFWLYDEEYIVDDKIELHVLLIAPQTGFGPPKLYEITAQASFIKCEHKIFT
jgi:hypothetical protein